jgi:hypothetical protein
MHYNESNVPRLSRNPTGQRSLNRLSLPSAGKAPAALNLSFQCGGHSQLQHSFSRNSTSECLSASAFLQADQSSSGPKGAGSKGKDLSAKEEKIRRLRL